MTVTPHELIPIFDLDGTLLDSDDALSAPFVALGVPPERVPFGLPLAEACALVGVTVDDYLGAYEDGVAAPFPGVDEMIAALPRWGVCSNKLGAYARREMESLGWRPDVALFVEEFGGPKRLQPVLDALGAVPADVIFVGDSEYDRRCAREAGVRFGLAGWNARVTPAPGDVVLHEPADVLRVLGAAAPG